MTDSVSELLGVGDGLTYCGARVIELVPDLDWLSVEDDRILCGSLEMPPTTYSETVRVIVSLADYPSVQVETEIIVELFSDEVDDELTEEDLLKLEQ